MKKAPLRFLIINGVLILLALSCFLVSRGLAGTLESQKAAARWAGEGGGSFAQLSCFLSVDDRLTLGDVYTFRQTLQNKLTEASMETPAGGSLFADAWSAFGALKVAGGYGSADAEAVAVGGN